LLIYFIFYS